MSYNNRNSKNCNAKFESKGKSMYDYYPTQPIIEIIDPIVYRNTRDGFVCDEYGRDLEMRKQYEERKYYQEYAAVTAVNNDDSYAYDNNQDKKTAMDNYKYNIHVDYGEHPTLFFKINRKTGKLEYRGRQTYEYC